MIRSFATLRHNFRLHGCKKRFRRAPSGNGTTLHVRLGAPADSRKGKRKKLDQEEEEGKRAGQNTLVSHTESGVYQIQTFIVGYFDSTMRWQDEDARMTIENTDDVHAATSVMETRFGHLDVGSVSLLCVSVEDVEIGRIRIQLSNISFRCRIGNAVENSVGLFDAIDGFLSELRCTSDATSDKNKRTAF